MPTVNADDKHYICTGFIHFPFQHRNGLPFFGCIPYLCMGIIIAPFIKNYPFIDGSIQVGIGTKYPKIYLSRPVPVYQVGDRLNWPASLKSRMKPIDGDEDGGQWDE